LEFSQDGRSADTGNLLKMQKYLSQFAGTELSYDFNLILKKYTNWTKKPDISIIR